jgi:alpha-tubulin suppressor-like RCC1 family protein
VLAVLGSVSVMGGVVAAPGVAAGAVRPSVSKLSVRTGSTGGGTLVRISGRGLTHVRWVEFGTRRAHIVSTPSGAVLVDSPAHAAGVVDVRVRTATGLSATVTPDRYAYRRPPLQIAVGTGTDIHPSFACARLTTGAECWGGNAQGELGHGWLGGVFSTPLTVAGLSGGLRDISTGIEDACAVTASHAAKCWGWEIFGQVGNGVDNNNGRVTKPVSVHGLSSGVASVVAGPENTCAVTTVGVVRCWGFDLFSQLGTNQPAGVDSAVPVTIAGLPPALSVGVGDSFVCALTTDRAVYCWGQDDLGELGDGGSVSGTASATPVQVQGLSAGVRSLSVGGNSACAVTAGRAVVCWGANNQGVLGDGQTSTAQVSSDVPVPVKNLQSGQSSVTIGTGATACATSTTGDVECWGANVFGELGNGNQKASPVPVQVKGMTQGTRQVAIGSDTVCAVTRTGQVLCWGNADAGTRQSDIPVTLPWFR